MYICCGEERADAPCSGGRKQSPEERGRKEEAWTQRARAHKTRTPGSYRTACNFVVFQKYNFGVLRHSIQNGSCERAASAPAPWPTLDPHAWRACGSRVQIVPVSLTLDLHAWRACGSRVQIVPVSLTLDPHAWRACGSRVQIVPVSLTLDPHAWTHPRPTRVESVWVKGTHRPCLLDP
jgi:hypothetical protein